jgi:glycosyltransferase involved in cell wall biosynthesis
MGSLTAVVTSHNYARFLPQCIDSALKFCDEVLVYDDGSTDESLEVLARYGSRITVVHRDEASGSPVWGSNLGIEQAQSTHLIFLDADNFLLSAPPLDDVDYAFGSIQVVDGNGAPRKVWNFAGWPPTADECWDRFVDAASRGSFVMPFPWGGVWRMEFLRDKSWREFATRGIADDYRTALDWCKARPTLAHHPQPFLAFRQHDGQMSRPNDAARKAAQRAEVARAAIEESMPPAASKHPDVVYLCRPGVNEELRFSLR